MSAISTSRMVNVFQSLLPALETVVGGPVHLVRMKGARCSFVAGDIPEDMPFVVSQRIDVQDDWALMVYPPAEHVVDRHKIRALFDARLKEGAS